MTGAHRGKTSFPRKRYGVRTVLMLLSVLLLLYSVGFLGVYIWTEDIDITQKTRNLLGLTNAPSPTIVKDVAPKTEPAIPRRPKSKPRFPREDAVDNLPILDEFTESIRAGRPILSGVEDDIVSLPKAAPTEGVFLDKPLTPLRCWDTQGFEHKADKCDSLYALNQLLKSKLHVFTACRSSLDAPPSGPLTFFIEADFLRNTTSFWLENDVLAQSKAEIIECVSKRFGAVSIEALPHRHSRYRLTGQVRFKETQQTDLALTRKTPSPSQAAIAKLERALASAAEVLVTRDRVRVRKSPVDGEIIGFISHPAKVKLVERSDDWCLVQTKRGHLGWLVCWGLAAVPPETDKDKTAEQGAEDESQPARSPADTTRRETSTASASTENEAPKPPSAPTAEQRDNALRTAREVAVDRKRLRVRRYPVDGAVIRFVSHPATVKLIEEKDDWCHIQTKRGQTGWVACWGLDTNTPPKSSTPPPPSETDDSRK